MPDGLKARKNPHALTFLNILSLVFIRILNSLKPQENHTMFPVNLVIGGVIGSVTTYVYKDEKAKEWVLKTGNTLKEGALSFVAAFRKKPEEAAVAKAATPKAEVVATAEKNTKPKGDAQSFAASSPQKTEEAAVQTDDTVDAAAGKNKYLKEGAQSFMAAFRKKSEEAAAEAARQEANAVDVAAEKKTK